ncbi:NfeD family protein [Lonsdalea quercina]|uniref:NfeD family protein n=1 Tax=Lonsdalea quercina TaxID=71657 RepID=UPI00397625B5
MMTDLLMTYARWFWLTLGGLLLAAEMLGAGGYLLWSGVSALLVGVLVWLLPLGLPAQGVAFAILTVLTACLWWYWLRQRTLRSPASTLNQRGLQVVGRRANLSEPVVNGLGRITLGDSSWRVTADRDLPAGTPVEIVAIDGITLRVRPQTR